MQHKNLFKYILDIESIIEEIDSVKELYDTYEKFENEISCQKSNRKTFRNYW